MNIRNSAIRLAFAAVAAFSAGTVSANIDIPVANSSFEIYNPLDQANDHGSWNNGPIPGWTITGSGGSFQPTLLALSFIPDGTTIAWSNGGTISQNVAQTSVSGVTYTLSVDIGTRFDAAGAGYADFVVNGTTTVATPLTPSTPGGWTTWEASYTAVSSGGPITIDLNALGVQGDYDNVHLSATPEPGFYGLLALGMSGIVFAVNRRRKP